jgi:hypothetical protein
MNPEIRVGIVRASAKSKLGEGGACSGDNISPYSMPNLPSRKRETTNNFRFGDHAGSNPDTSAHDAQFSIPSRFRHSKR